MAYSFTNKVLPFDSSSGLISALFPSLRRRNQVIIVVYTRCRRGVVITVTGVSIVPSSPIPLSQLTIHANVTGLTECGCTRRRPKDGSARASSSHRSGEQVYRGTRKVALRLNLRPNRSRRGVLHSLFGRRIERLAAHHRHHQLAPTIRPRVLQECGLLGYHCRVLVARPSSLPEAFPTNCSSERTTTKTKEDPESPESVILLWRA